MSISEIDLWLQVAKAMSAAVDRINRGESFENFSPIQLHNIYLLASYRYYELKPPDSIMSDHVFDQMCRYILDNYEKFEATVWHQKDTLSREAMSAGTGLGVKYPVPIKEISYYYSRFQGYTIPDSIKIKKKEEKRKNLSFF